MLLPVAVTEDYTATLDEAGRQALVVGACWLARHVVDDVATRLPRSVDRQDLHAAALLGLVNAARVYDPSLGVPFDAFARTRMRWAVLDELRAHDPLTRADRRRVQAWRALSEQHRHPSVAATCSFVRTLLAVSARDGAEVEDAADPGAVTPESHALERELVEAVRDALVLLPPRCREVVTAYFIDGRDMRSIAADLGVTPSRVSQLCAEGVRRLRSVLDADGDRPAVRSA
jgi:RNA polymerase sigma factor FliA